jgi:uncharacterized oxidoreductase
MDEQRRHGVRIGHEALGAATRTLLTAGGSEPAEAAIVAEHLVEANLRGHDSHGVGMLPHYVRNLRAGTLHPNRHAEFVKKDGAFATVDGGMGYGQVIAREATDWAIGKARENGVAILALRNTHHIGRVGTYGEQACAAGLVSLSFVNAISGEPRVAPWRGRDGRFATNPLCFAVPGSAAEPPIVLDMATSRIALGKVRVAHNEGRALPEGMVIDAAGRPSTDPGVVYREPRGFVLPFGEHKGYALAMLCELLAGAVAGGGTTQPERPRDRGIVNGMLSIVLDPARFVDRAWFEHEARALVRHAKDAPPADPALPVLVPGEPERISRAKRITEGVPIDAATWREIGEAADAVELGAARFAAIATGRA